MAGKALDRTPGLICCQNLARSCAIVLPFHSLLILAQQGIGEDLIHSGLIAACGNDHGNGIGCKRSQAERLRQDQHGQNCGQDPGEALFSHGVLPFFLLNFSGYGGSRSRFLLRVKPMLVLWHKSPLQSSSFIATDYDAPDSENPEHRLQYQCAESTSVSQSLTAAVLRHIWHICCGDPLDSSRCFTARVFSARSNL